MSARSEAAEMLTDLALQLGGALGYEGNHFDEWEAGLDFAQPTPEQWDAITR